MRAQPTRGFGIVQSFRRDSRYFRSVDTPPLREPAAEAAEQCPISEARWFELSGQGNWQAYFVADPSVLFQLTLGRNQLDL